VGAKHKRGEDSGGGERYSENNRQMGRCEKWTGLRLLNIEERGKTEPSSQRESERIQKRDPGE